MCQYGPFQVPMLLCPFSIDVVHALQNLQQAYPVLCTNTYLGPFVSHYQLARIIRCRQTAMTAANLVSWTLRSWAVNIIPRCCVIHSLSQKSMRQGLADPRGTMHAQYEGFLRLLLKQVITNSIGHLVDRKLLADDLGLQIWLYHITGPRSKGCMSCGKQFGVSTCTCAGYRRQLAALLGSTIHETAAAITAVAAIAGNTMTSATPQRSVFQMIARMPNLCSFSRDQASGSPFRAEATAEHHGLCNACAPSRSEGLALNPLQACSGNQLGSCCM